MIQYMLKCREGHEFEAWFASSAAFDEQAGRGLVACAVCGGGDVVKSLMAPRLGGAEGEGPATPRLSGPPADPTAAKLAKLRRHIETHSDYVGPDFARQARGMHHGDIEHRSIWGEASGAEARALVEDGVPVAPLPPAVERDD